MQAIGLSIAPQMAMCDDAETISDREAQIKSSATNRVDDGPMVKAYYQFRKRAADQSGSIADGFVMGLADFACLGWQLYDLAGYPYESEDEALYSDWMKLGQDFEIAREKIEEERR